MLERIFAPASVDSLFSDAAMLAAMARFERGLAQAQASIGLIPDSAAQAISRACNELGDPSATDDNADVLAGGCFDPAKLYPAARNSGTLVIPFLKALGEQVATIDPEAVRFLHHGSTSQDVIDSALAMQCKEAGRRVLDALERTGAALCGIVDAHRGTMMIGRTLLQPAAPIPFAWKAASWLDPLTRSRRHLRTSLLDSAVLQFGGAVGTLSGQNLSPEKTQAVAQRLADSLGLMMPAASWHASRDRFARLGSEIAILCGSLGKVGGDIALLMQSEVAEAFEPAGLGRGGSSAMPHKRNPVGALLMREAALRAPGLVATLVGDMDVEHERGLGQWQSSWWTMRNLFGAAASSLAAAEEVLGGLQVNAKGMQGNIDRMHGFVYSEAVSAHLAPKLGKKEAQALVSELCETALAKDMSLRQVLGRDSRISAVMNLGDLERLFDPESQRGASGPMIDQVLAAWRSSR
jgi:3-carboxy-cis,cis-muconate cycloisomerase